MLWLDESYFYWKPSSLFLQGSQDTWVTVFGFTAQEQHIVLREFAKCGNIVQFGNGREDRVNWLHLQYSVSLSPKTQIIKIV